MAAGKLILCVGNEQGLAVTRARVIETTGASVVLTASCAAACLSARQHEFSAVIIGHGFDLEEQELIEAAVVSVQGPIPVLRLPTGVVSPELVVKFVVGVPTRFPCTTF